MGKPKPVQHVWKMHRSLMGTEWNSQWSWCGWDWRHGWKRARCLPDPAPAKQWTYEAWPQGWILALYGDVVWWYDLDTPMYRLQRAHAHLVFRYQACLHEWSIWIASAQCSSRESTGVDDAERCSCKRCVSHPRGTCRHQAVWAQSESYSGTYTDGLL